jgi:hypothetical protein
MRSSRSPLRLRLDTDTQHCPNGSGGELQVLAAMRWRAFTPTTVRGWSD